MTNTEKTEKTSLGAALSSETTTKTAKGASSGSTATATEAAASSSSRVPSEGGDTLFGWVPPSFLVPYLFYVRAVSGVLIAFFLVAPDRFLSWLWNLLWTVVGVTLGIGFGAGLALHVFHQLQAWQNNHDKNQKKREAGTSYWQGDKGDRQGNRNGQRNNSVRDSTTTSTSSVMSSSAYHHHMLMSNSASFLEDGNSYLTLMAQAGYYIPDRVLRGQVLREDHSFFNVVYKFTDEKIANQQAVQLMAEEFKSLPTPVTREMGRFIEHVMRDYIAGWYSRLDNGIEYRIEEEKRKEGVPRDDGDVVGGDTTTGNNSVSSGTPIKRNSQRSISVGNSTKSTSVDPIETPSEAKTLSNSGKTHDSNHSTAAPRKMVFSTLTHRRAPMIDATYRVLSAAFGNLATRAEHVNVFELVLLKWTQVLGHTFKTYRTLRKIAQEKNEIHGIRDRSPTEVEITREYLLAGRLHQAVVFGLDVPSLLFADASGQECGCGTGAIPNTPTQVLEERLYNTNIIRECELDYNRVVASRLIRALLPKSESGSNCVTSLVVEIFAGCVFQPLMNLWIPSFLNDIIVKSMTSSASSSQETTTSSQFDSHSVHTLSEIDQGIETSSAECTNEITKEGRSGQGEVTQMTAVETEDVKGENDPKTEVSDLKLFNRLRSESIDSLDEVDEFFDEGGVSVGDKILVLSSMALAELAKFADFDMCRDAKANNRGSGVNWDDPDCQTAVLKLVLVLEAAILDGRCSYRKRVIEVDTNASPASVESDAVKASAEDSSHETMTHLLMEMTSDMEAFEKRIVEAAAIDSPLGDTSQEDFRPEANEITTLRTLISTWLHTGQLFRALSLIERSVDTILAPFYTDDAFMLNRTDRERLVREMKNLDGVDIMVETMVVLSSTRLDITEEYKLMTSAAVLHSDQRSRHRTSYSQPRSGVPGLDISAENMARDLADFGQSTPRFLDFQRNAAFAASLRAERDRRLRAWEARPADTNIVTVLRKTASKKIDFDLHAELHNLVRLFYNGTNIMSIRDAARKGETGGEDPNKSRNGNEKVSLLTVETASPRRRIEVPDDDSSFLLRAQSRPLNPVSVHRDDRNHDLSYKSFLATYEEPSIASGSTRYNGGRFVRRCFIQYYPSDRTASVALQNDARKLDKRKGASNGSEKNVLDQNTAPYVNAAFLRERHLCQKWFQRSTQSFLSSSLMESTDFSSAPRTGKALDFVYRMSLFERPIVDLSGKRFTVQDSSSKGVHRADSSSLEISDASISYMLLYIGKEFEPRGSDRKADFRNSIEMGPDGYPTLFFRITTKTGEQVNTEIKPYRMSFIRAALLVTSSRQEAQNQSLIECVKAGSAKSATKTRTEEQLRPTLKILEFANDRSKDQTKASCLVRDLKLGIYHIDKQQLRRNGLLNLRYPTTILQLNAEVEGTAPAKDVPLAKLTNSKHLPDETLYRVRCTTVVELVDPDDGGMELDSYALDDGSLAALYREEWVVYRSMKDFQTLHKHLKSEVNLQESTMSTGTRIVGAAAAALSSRSSGRKNKKILIPSLAQASKIGAMGVTKRSIEKRKELLDEYLGYLLSSNSLMNRCSEILLFLGASHPFPPEVTVTKAPANFMDPLGRMCFVRSVALKESGDVVKLRRKISPRKPTRQKFRTRSTSHASNEAEGVLSRTSESSFDISDMDPAIANKVDQVALAEVRNHIVDLMRYAFGFENASFVRSQMLAALETASFVAMAKQSDFRKLLYQTHCQQLNGEALGGWIRMLLDLLWPDGIWLKPKPVLSKEEEASLRIESKTKLHEGFPDHFRKILGKELTKESLDMIHDMLQNRLVIKSMFYMLFDLVWIEILPELRDSLPCASALDLDLL